MFRGTVAESLDAYVGISIIRPAEAPLALEAILDTGFSGFLTLPLSAIQEMQLKWLYRQRGLLANGSFHTF